MSIQSFHAHIADRLTAINSVSETVGPGRMARCNRVSVQVKYGTGATVGSAEVQWSHHQSFPGTPVVVGTIAFASANSGDAVDIPSKYFNGFIRVKLVTASDADGMSAWASGNN